MFAMLGAIDPLAERYRLGLGDVPAGLLGDELAVVMDVVLHMGPLIVPPHHIVGLGGLRHPRIVPQGDSVRQ
ncbi:hypothetical protein MBLL_03199 [Methylobacterium bullatum]|uniref:Uncharacterized protein n=1 Tax=Methylobacterium bullatum TaxID=570505 RepID=A0A679KFK3_9HYPH|nr:hypothetical protein MBLL_03199 [Methylobacterium bullatum]